MERKISLIICILSVALFATAEGKYNIKGTVSNELNGSKVYISFYSQKQQLPNDSALIQNGAFTFSGNYNGDDIATIFTNAKQKNVKGFHCVVNVENATVKVNCTSSPAIVSGGKLATVVNAYNDTIYSYNKREKDAGIRKLYAEFRDKNTTKERQQEIVRLVNDFSKRSNMAQESLMKSNINNVLGAFILSDIAYKYTDEEVEAFVASGNNEILKFTPVKKLMARIEAAKVRRPGNKYIDFEQPDKDGKIHKLSDYVGKNKYVLVDFWASWCAPCRGEIPNVKKAYEKFHSMGFEVVAVSLDSKRNAWLQAVEKEQMAWPQLSDDSGWANSAAQKYGVNAIPCTMLIDENGTIIGGDYRDDQLINKLTELFK